MLNLDHKKAQAALELAVFGAILIFLLGSIVRTALGNSYAQDQNFKAMRMALLSSWRSSESANSSHNSASVLIVEDRLSPDFNKYGDIDRNPYLANGSGTFSYYLLYPLDPSEVAANLPVMDMYINGQHFPFSVASYVSGKTIQGPGANCTSGTTCQINQCLRNNREWVGGIVRESQFAYILPIQKTGTTGAQRLCQAESNSGAILKYLATGGLISQPTGETSCALTGQAIPVQLSSSLFSQDWAGFIQLFEPWYGSTFPISTNADIQTMHTAESTILQYLKRDSAWYKLFYTVVANPGNAAGGSSVSPVFSTNARMPTCSPAPCKDEALTQDLTVMDGETPPQTYTNTNGDMQYDLLRLGYYTATPPSTACFTGFCKSVEQQFPHPLNPPNGTCSTCMRNYIAWQWAATAGVSAAMIGLNTSNNQYPNYDVDGRLKEVTIYGINWDPGPPPVLKVSYEDMQGGDIDETWDSSTCGPKPGLQGGSQIFTFTQDGTYLQINEGKLYNPETGQVVRSANKRDNVDLVQRNIQLSNNTGRFCTSCADGSMCGGIVAGECADSTKCTSPVSTPAAATLYRCTRNSTGCANPNDVEICLNSSAPSAPSCVTQSSNFKLTCFDAFNNMLYVRSRLQDLRGRFWMTNASGQLQVQ